MTKRIHADDTGTSVRYHVVYKKAAEATALNRSRRSKRHNKKSWGVWTEWLGQPGEVGLRLAGSWCNDRIGEEQMVDRGQRTRMKTHSGPRRKQPRIMRRHAETHWGGQCRHQNTPNNVATTRWHMSEDHSVCWKNDRTCEATMCTPHESERHEAEAWPVELSPSWKGFGGLYPCKRTGGGDLWQQVSRCAERWRNKPPNASGHGGGGEEGYPEHQLEAVAGEAKFGEHQFEAVEGEVKLGAKGKRRSQTVWRTDGRSGRAQAARTRWCGCGGGYVDTGMFWTGDAHSKDGVIAESTCFVRAHALEGHTPWDTELTQR